MSPAQFKAALKRNGFAHVSGYTYRDLTGATDLHYYAKTDACVVDRRGTIAKLLKDRDAAIERRDQLRAIEKATR